MIPSQTNAAFLDYLESWQQNLPSLPWAQAVVDPGRTALLAIDVTNGFCRAGALFSPRVARIVNPIVQLFQRAWLAGVRHFVLPQDTHQPDAVEFSQWPAHCVRGSSEAETVSEIKALPFYDRMVVLPKNSINPALHSDLPAWLETHLELDTFIVTGDCTDLCTYQLAMYVRLEANASQKHRRVIVPANCVDTYDISIEQAGQLGILPHPADVIHPIFLYHMALNGVEVYRGIE
jgi:nicotinamidase-related amidase